MFALLILTGATLANEIGTSLGKRLVGEQKESIYTMGFLSILWAASFMFLLAFVVPKDFFVAGFPGGFVFSLASLPTFLPRIALEITQLHVTLFAIVRADRSTFGFLRILTIPLLLGADIFLGYSISILQLVGIALIVLSLVFLFINHGLSKRGIFFVLFSAVNGAITLSLYKYNITHFNSVEAEQGLTMLALVVYTFFMARYVCGENPIRFLVRPVFLFQSFIKGVASVGISFSFLFVPASIATTGKRSLNILWSMLSGNIYFHEKRFFVKFVSFLMIVVGLVLLAF